MVKKILLFLSLLSFSFGFSQIKGATVMVTARAQKDKILVRWAINSPTEWQRAHKKGFIVTRFTIKRDGKLLLEPEKLLLTPKPLQPAPLEKWMDIIQKDNNAAIIAQSIYGESFQITDVKEGPLSKIVNIAAELEQRYTFALYAADMSFEASKLAGWGLEDSEVKPNEIYAYQVGVFQNLKVKNSSYVVGLKDFELLPVIQDFIAIPDDKKIVLSWDYETFKKIYTSFMVEKSENGTDFSPIATTQLVNLNDNPNKPSRSMYYVDTIAKNNKTYHYRLYGVSAFGEKGQLTKPITVEGVGALMNPPRIINYQMDPDNSVTLEWEYDVKAEENTDSFEVNLSDKDNGIYKVVSRKLPASSRKFLYKNLDPSNYFTISVIGKNKKRLTSQSMLVQPIDSIPPAIPVGLEGKIDSLGVVKLKWKANLEKDFLGYRILKANTPTEEFVDIYHKSYDKTEYQDKVSLQLTNKKVYYQIASEDKRHNVSKPSETLVLVKPDKIPPTAPIFKDYESKNGVVTLQWIRSYSDDVAYHTLRRRLIGQEDWIDLIQINDTLQQEFIDDKVEKNKTYQYVILARDKTNLWSATENSLVTLKVQDFRPTVVLTNFLGVVDRENKNITLSWSYTSKEKVTQLSIYKNKVGEPPTLWRELPSKVTTLVDTNLNINADYEYHINPALKSNTPAMTESIIVKY
jgi:uncharacterized protein